MVNTSPSKKNFVHKRDGRIEDVHLDKITSRIQKLCYGLNMDHVDPLSITLKVISGLYPGVTTVELDTLAAETAALMSTQHPDYGILAARIAVSNLHKETKKHFSDVIDNLYNAVDKSKNRIDIISEEYHAIVMKNADRLNSCIIYDRDFYYNYFGFKTLENLYLLKINGKTAERPQHMLMRVAVGIHGEDIDSAIETYNYMSDKYFIHSSTTLSLAATVRAQLASSYLVAMPDDSLEGIFKCVKQCALISKDAGGVGLSIHNIRAKGTDIVGTNGVSNGLVPMLRVFNNASLCVIQPTNKRTGAVAVYLEPWHADIFEFLNLKKPSGKDEYRARDLSYALWTPDLFMKRVKNDDKWSLMCPHQSPGLHECWGEEFEKLYEKYEAEDRYIRQVQARDLWRAICALQVETGSPFILYKDACNRKSNQQNLGTIKSSNLGAEIVEYTSPDEIAVCSLASIAVNMFINSQRSGFDFEKLKEVTKIVTRNLNKIIDINYYPLPEAHYSNTRHRPIGIGVQGLADAFILLRMPFDGEEARLLNTQIFETLYYGALEASSEIAEKDGPYSTYDGSPASKGILQYDMWNVKPTNLWDWSALKQRIAKHGVRNSLVVALMPTESTAEILGNNKSTEPISSNIYTRKVLSGEFQIINQHLLKDLTEKGLWNDVMKNQIIAHHGSIQNIADIPDDLKKIYRTAWEIPQKGIIEMAADRGAFIDQSQSMNVHIPVPNYAIMSSMHFYGWERGLKTGMYYLKTKPTANRTQATTDATNIITSKTNGISNGTKSNEERTKEEEAALICSLENPGACEMCSA